MSHRSSARPRGALPVVLLTLLALLAGSLVGSGRPSGALPPPTTEPPDTPEPTEPPEPDPPHPHPPPPTPPPDVQCDAPGGLARPAGTIPPGYVYTPTAFTGLVADPQPDDTFAADAPGHAAHTGRLRTRTANGREELLVCAHVGTNTASDALTAFPLTGPGAHPATIAPRVVLIDATGGATSYDLGAPGIDGTLSHYAGATDPHTGYVQMWVPFTPALREPGFTVRVEIRGTAALTPGGTTQVMGADEVFVHLGPVPTAASAPVEQALGVALDDAAIAERPTDPGADDLSTILAPTLEAAIAAGVENPDDFPRAIPGDWVWDPSALATTKGSGTIHSIDTFVHSLAVDVESFNATEGRVVVTFEGSARPKLTANLRRIGVPSIVDGSCEVEALVDVQGRAAFTIDLSPDLRRPVVDVGFVDVDGTIATLRADGTLTAVWFGFPTDLNCNSIEGDIHEGVAEQVDAELDALGSDGELAAMEDAAAGLLSVADLASGPLRTLDISLPDGLGATVDAGRYVPTAPPGHIGGDMFTTTQGIDVAAGARVDDQGGTRFPHSYVPSATTTLVQATHGRDRVGGGPFDLGLVVSGATVNQLLRALTAGRFQPVVPPPGDPGTGGLVDPGQIGGDVGLLDLDAGGGVTTAPSASPLYLPSPPAGWPADGPVDVLVPSLRVSIPVPEVATMAVDISVGLDAGIDATNHLVPTVEASDIRARFLRLGRELNQVTDPTAEPGGTIAGVVALLRDAVPARVAAALEPVALPDIGATLPGGATAEVHVADLTIGTVGGGHLGAQVEVLPGPPPPPPPALVVTWATGADGVPTSLTADLTVRDLPGTGPANLRWTITDLHATGAGAVVYQSPPEGEAATTRTVPAGGLAVHTDPCDDGHSVAVALTVVVSRGDEERIETGFASRAWPGTPPAHPPHDCFPEPEPEPEPDPPPLPPICEIQPWKCPEEQF